MERPRSNLLFGTSFPHFPFPSAIQFDCEYVCRYAQESEAVNGDWFWQLFLYISENIVRFYFFTFASIFSFGFLVSILSKYITRLRIHVHIRRGVFLGVHP